jgi:hypothetical protein
MTKFRPHRGGLAEAMAEVVEVTNIEELKIHIGKSWPYYKLEDLADLTIEKYGEGIDHWDTHIVYSIEHGVFGFTDGPLGKTWGDLGKDYGRKGALWNRTCWLKRWTI